MTTSTKNRKRKRFPAFFVGYILFVIIAIISIYIALGKLWVVLEDYESSMPVYTMENVYEMFKEHDYERILQLTGDMSLVSRFEKQDDVIKYYGKIFDGKEITYQQKAGYTPTNPVYVIKADDKIVTTVKLKKQAQTTEYGFDKWELASISGILKTEEKLSVTVPASAEVYVNGIALDARYIVQKDIKVNNMDKYPDMTALLGEDIKRVTMVRYEIEDFVTSPELKVIGFLQNELTLSYDEKTKEYFADYEPTTELKTEFEARAFEVSKAYANFITHDIKFAEFGKYLLKNSTVYKNFSAMWEVMWYTDHILVEFNDVVYKDFKFYSNDLCSININFDHCVHRTKTDIFHYPTDITYYFLKHEGQWYVANMFLN